MSIERSKVAIIGGGNIGGTLTHLITLKGLARDIVLLDKTADYAKGKALDIEHTLPMSYNDVNIIGTSDYADIKGAKVVIVTAGISRKPGMSRDDLLETNIGIMKTVADGIKQHAKNAFVIIVTNPLDAMVYAFHRLSGLEHKMVIGMAGVLDSARFKLFLAKELGVSIEDINAFVLGGHGDTMVPLAKYTSVAGIPISEMIEMGWLTQEKFDAIVERTRNGGGEIVQLLQKNSAFYAPAASAIQMAESYLLDKKRILPCAAYLNGEYGVTGMYIGVPIVIGKHGVEKIIDINLKGHDKENMNKSIEAVSKLVQEMEKFFK